MLREGMKINLVLFPNDAGGLNDASFGKGVPASETY